MFSLKYARALSLLGLALASACAEPECPDGFDKIGKVCRRHDSGSSTTQSESGVEATPSEAGVGGAADAAGSGNNGSASDIDASMAESTAVESCTREGEVRCGAVAGLRDRCMGGFWKGEACAAGEVCTAQPSPGSCQAVATVCRGSSDQAVCDAQGVMYQCSAQGLVASRTACASSQHCQKGIAGGKCLTCIPESYKCTGTALERCNADGTGYVAAKTCTTAALCNASVGDCTQMTCLPNKYTCQGDMLRRCNAAQSGYDDVKMCRPGLCDATEGQCDECTAGSKSCETNVAATCSVDGQTVGRAPCPAATPQCVGLGRCAQCAGDADCPDPGACKTRRCNLATGTCEPQNQASRTACAGGFCDATGSCRGCLQNSDCPDPGDCKTAYCNPSTRTCAPTNVASGMACKSSTGYCNGSGSCVGCTSDTQCSAPICRTARCSGGACVVSVAATGARDSRCPSMHVCDAASTCVECTATSHCDPLEVCENGRCMPSCGNGRLDTAAGETCEVGLSGRDDWSCNRETCKLTGLTGATLGKNCDNVDCSVGEVCDRNGAISGFPACLPACGAGDTCSLPPGWSGFCQPGAATPKGCIVRCVDGRCPNLSTCRVQGSGTGFCL